MAKQIANAFTMVNTFSNKTVNSLQNSLNIFAILKLTWNFKVWK